MTASNYCNDNATFILENKEIKTADQFAAAAWENYVANSEGFNEEIEFDESAFKVAAAREFETSISQPENGWVA